MKKISLLLCFMMLTSLLKAQTDLRQMSVDYIKQTKNLQFSPAQWLITDQIYDKNTQTTFLYLRQMHAGKEIFNVNVNFSIKNNKITYMAGTPKKDYSVRTTSSSMSAESAIRAAATGLNLKITEPLTSSSSANAKGVSVTKFSKAGISQEEIPVKEMYYLNAKNELVSVWNLSIYENSGDNWWDLLVDAQSGQIVNKANWVTHCNFGLHEKNNQNGNDDCEDKHVHTPSNLVGKIVACPEDKIIIRNNAKITNTIPLVGGNQYNVFALPIEAPSYGVRSIVQDPENLLASPFGWHDTNGVTGAEFTITRGNNVYAYRDADANNLPDPGTSPDGGASLNFDFPFPTTQEPETYVPASTTNLFYWNNKVHDFYYRYGFDDASGNFQVNNYGRGGLGNDPVNAESQDGSGTNNANFGTPPDGGSPRMQMYLWDDGTPTNLLTVNSPVSLAGGYASTPSTTFGLQITATTNVTGNIQLMNDGSADPTLGCVASPAGSLTGKIALIDRGSPVASPGLGTFVLKAKNAQNAGAIGVIIVNNVATPAVSGMSGVDATITIPIVMISQANGLIFKNSLVAGNTISATFRISRPAGAIPRRDASFDSGIVAHEYGHGISNRLTGGPANTSCLQNNEQMGEGWSDFFGLVMTMLPSHTGATPRGIGTYATYEPITGGGIRPAPYTTNLGVNPYTYSGVANPSISQPHGIGFIWCTMLWEINWGMITRYGFDNDLQNGNGGNNKTIQLVLLALKLQPCGPGFVDGRDALLAADTQLFGGANHDIIWLAFTKRGLGLNASQGDPDVRGDGVENTTIPPQFNTNLCTPGDSKISLPTSFPTSAELCVGNMLAGNFGRVFGAVAAVPILYDYGYILTKNGNIFQFNANAGAFDFASLGVGVYTIVGISYKNGTPITPTGNIQTLTTYLTSRIGSPISSIQADITANTICASLAINNTNNIPTQITIVSNPSCVVVCSPVGGKITLPAGLPVAPIKICEKDELASGNAFGKEQTFVLPAVATDYDYNYLLTKNGNILQFNATGVFDFANLTEGTYTVAGISYKKTNPQTVSSYLTSRIGTTIVATKAAITAQNTCAEITTQSTLNAEIIITIQSKAICAITATDPKFRQSVKVFPNPTSQNINVEFTNLPNETLQIIMYNMQGMEVLAQKVNTTNNISLENISLKNLSKGVYVMKIQMKDKFVMEKIIVN